MEDGDNGDDFTDNKERCEDRDGDQMVRDTDATSPIFIKEIKKQLSCYKTEISTIKKTESYITMENYQKLVNDFNSLYDHYKVAKQLNKKLKSEL